MKNFIKAANQALGAMAFANAGNMSEFRDMLFQSEEPVNQVVHHQGIDQGRSPEGLLSMTPQHAI